jgi:uracil-DNA glycosylase
MNCHLVLLCVFMSRIFTSKSLSFASRDSTFTRRAAIVHRRSIATTSTITMMPEGPEVKILVDQLQGAVGSRLLDVQFVSGRYVRHSKPSGFDDFAKTMTPLTKHNTEDSVDTIQEWNAKGKFIYILLDKGAKTPANNANDFQRSIWITLGMSGRFLNQEKHQEDPRFARWYLSLLMKEGTERKIYYHDTRNFGTVKFSLSREALTTKLNSLGLDILDPMTTEDDFVQLVTNQKSELNICRFLMNQSKLCGVGNYILSEALYRAGIDPFASLSEIDEEQQRRLFREIQSIAFESYEAQGLSRRSGSYRDVEGKRGRFEFALQCYGRESCARGKTVFRETKGPHGRTIWYTEDQLFMPRILRYGSVPEADESTGQLDDVEVPVSVNADGHSSEAIPSESNAMNQAANNKDRLITKLNDNGWKEALSDAIAAPSFDELSDFLAEERRRGAVIFPPEQDIFAALNKCPFDKVKVVIVGQDPYHGQGQGHGLAFSVRKGVRPPPSLMNIFKELMDDVHIDTPQHGSLEYWADQGVLLLNTVLTVRQGEANSHARKGWEQFTDAVIEKLNNEKQGLVFLLWGNPAANKASGVDDERHTIIRSSHPSPLGATKTSSPFLGSRCFSRANKALSDSGQTPIDWNVR